MFLKDSKYERKNMELVQYLHLNVSDFTSFSKTVHAVFLWYEQYCLSSLRSAYKDLH